jgi:hypothetical protein
LGEEFSVVLEIDPQHDRDAEDELSMRDGIKDVVGDVFPPSLNVVDLRMKAS